MKQKTITKKILDSSNLLHNISSIRQSLLNSLKQGLFAFLSMLLLLELLKNAQSIIHGKQLKVIDAMDVAIALLGFLLIFLGNLLKRIYGRVQKTKIIYRSQRWLEVFQFCQLILAVRLVRSNLLQLYLKGYRGLNRFYDLLLYFGESYMF